MNIVEKSGNINPRVSFSKTAPKRRNTQVQFKAKLHSSSTHWWTEEIIQPPTSPGYVNQIWVHKTHGRQVIQSLTEKCTYYFSFKMFTRCTTIPLTWIVQRPFQLWSTWMHKGWFSTTTRSQSWKTTDDVERWGRTKIVKILVSMIGSGHNVFVGKHFPSWF